MKQPHLKLLTTVAMTAAVLLLAACEPASEPSSPWTKSDSPWGKRTAAVTDTAAEQPAPSPSETYRQELHDQEIGSDAGYGMTYQPESVKSIVPAEPLADEPVEPVPPPVAKPAAKKVAAAAAAPATVDSNAGADNFKDLAGSYYTLQVIASVDKKSVYSFAKNNQLSTRYVVPTVRGGTTWYVLLLDVYPNKVAARSALDEAAAKLPTKPWIRTVASVQQLMP